MLEAVTGLQQTSQDAAGDTTFGWIFVTDADGYDIDVDGVASGQVPGASATVSAAAPGAHTLGVAPYADPTPATVIDFSIPGTSPPPPSSDSTPLIVAGVVGVAALVGAVVLTSGRKTRR